MSSSGLKTRLSWVFQIVSDKPAEKLLLHKVERVNKKRSQKKDSLKQPFLGIIKYHQFHITKTAREMYLEIQLI